MPGSRPGLCGFNSCHEHLSDIHHFLVIDNLFKRYTVIVQVGSRTTSVYCDECEEWVAQWPGEQVTTQTHIEFYEKIVDAHKHDFPDLVEFSDDTVSFK